MDTIPSALRESIPYRLGKKDRTLCEWLYTNGNPFREPFFTDSISAFKRFEENCNGFTSICSLEIMEKWAAGLNDVPDPSAVIFHVSRCGSTLFSQLLGLNDRHMVLSEVPFFDELLRLPLTQDEFAVEQRSALLKAAIRIYANSREERPKHIFIKTDSWHLCFYDQIRNTFPNTPFILLYRDPWEVIQSQQRRRGMQSVPGVIEPALFGFTRKEATETDLDKYMALVLQQYFSRIIAISNSDALTLLVNYAQGAEDISKQLFSFLNISMDDELNAGIAERVKYHGKYPGQLFNEENENASPPGFISPVMELYNELEQIRLLRKQ